MPLDAFATAGQKVHAMTEMTNPPDVDGALPLTRLVTTPIRLVESHPDLPKYRRFLCEVAVDCPDLSLREGQEVVVVLAPPGEGGIDLPEDVLSGLGRGEDGEDGDDLSFDGVRWSSRDGSPVVIARAWSRGWRPSHELAEAAVDDFLTRTVGEHTPFSMIEDGDETDGPKCGWAFWVLEDDTTSYLHADLKVEWYGTSYDPDSVVEDDDQETPSP